MKAMWWVFLCEFQVWLMCYLSYYSAIYDIVSYLWRDPTELINWTSKKTWWKETVFKTTLHTHVILIM